MDEPGKVIASGIGRARAVRQPAAGLGRTGSARLVAGLRIGRPQGASFVAICAPTTLPASVSRARCTAPFCSIPPMRLCAAPSSGAISAAKRKASSWKKLFGRDALIQLTCNPPLTNFTLTKLLWVRETEPQNWARVAHVMLPKDYVRFRLTGERAIDMADASGTLLLDVANRRWSTEVLSKSGIDVRLASGAVRVSAGLRKSVGRGRRGHGTASGNSRSRRRRRPGGRRGRHGHRARRRGQRHHWNFRRRLCRDRSSRTRSARALAHFLSRHPGTLARDGRDPGRGIVFTLVSRSLRRRSEQRRPRSLRHSCRRSQRGARRL